MGTSNTSKYPKPGTPSGGYVNVVLDLECAETLLVALSYALGVESGKKKKKKKKKKTSPKTTPAPKTTTPSPKTTTTPKTTPKPK